MVSSTIHIFIIALVFVALSSSQECKNKSKACWSYRKFCGRSWWVDLNCKSTCKLCDKGGVKTTKQTTTTTTTTTTTAPTTKASTTTTTTAIVSKTPPATEKTTTTIPPRKTRELLTSGCGDKASFCFIRETFKPSQHCSKYGHICIWSCRRCRGSEQEKCSNLTNRALDCSQRNCQDPDRMIRLRAHTKCAKYCCNIGQLF
uniref:ShKT domain-containing protein n=1 Tax=Clytia hemisphaerica TaxID=252671 RepID=A0A7M5U8Z3_9CNID